MELFVTFETITCCHKGCGLTFAVPSHWKSKRKEDHEVWYCPNGHSQHFPGESDMEKERRLRQKAEQDNAYQRDMRDRERRAREHQERRANAFKGHCTRIRKRVAVGNCPCGCDGTFKNLRRHMQRMHPDWQPDAEPKDETKEAA